MTGETTKQKILFGCPGTGKSHKVEADILKGYDKSNIINCVFHPEYSYGDFMGKLMPFSRADHISYNYYAGHFMRALAQAYKNIKEDAQKTPAPVALVIDEINRGNTAAIFGSVLQLLDRAHDGSSVYCINLSIMELDSLVHLVDEDVFDDSEVKNFIEDKRLGKAIEKLNATLGDYLSHDGIKLPPNLSIIGTMNTSDEFIYYMDSAFKRRWDWEYVGLKPVKPEKDTKISAWNWKISKAEERENILWTVFVDNLNIFIKAQSGSIRKVEDKQIGYWFIKAKDNNIITQDQIKGKLMFFLWDSVFQRSKKPLEVLLSDNDSEVKLITFGDFSGKVVGFIEKVKGYETAVES
ncbi:MAG: hypothetical protein Q9M28_09190 [Mariprofundaceae bacterium]|nr:hypothetical protein [Mariprofundaceae bacterium]